MAPASGKVVLITGCSAGGIGAALSAEYARQGATVYATARQLERMEGLLELGCHCLQLDITDAAQVDAVARAVLQEAGRVDILVNNAGAGMRGAVTDTPLQAVRSLFEANYIGHVAVTQAVVPSMVARRSGLVINIGSVAGFWSAPFMGVYASTKAALAALSDALRAELAPFGVRVMHVAPGFVRTRIAQKGVVYVSPHGPYATLAADIQADLFEASVGRFAPPPEPFCRRLVAASLGAAPCGLALLPPCLARLLPLPAPLPSAFGYGVPPLYLDGSLSWSSYCTGRWLPSFVADGAAILSFGLYKLLPWWPRLAALLRGQRGTGSCTPDAAAVLRSGAGGGGAADDATLHSE